MERGESFMDAEREERRERRKTRAALLNCLGAACGLYATIGAIAAGRTGWFIVFAVAVTLMNLMMAAKYLAR